MPRTPPRRALLRIILHSRSGAIFALQAEPFPRHRGIRVARRISAHKALVVPSSSLRLILARKGACSAKLRPNVLVQGCLASPCEPGEGVEHATQVNACALARSRELWHGPSSRPETRGSRARENATPWWPSARFCTSSAGTIGLSVSMTCVASTPVSPAWLGSQASPLAPVMPPS